MQAHLQERFGRHIPVYDHAAYAAEREVFFMLDVMGGAMIAEANRQHVPMPVPIDPKMFDDRSVLQDALAAAVTGKPIFAPIAPEVPAQHG